MFRSRIVKTAFILGAGLGLRLRPLTDHCPKPLLPVRGRPMITYAMDHLLSMGVERFIVNTHHCARSYEDVFPDRVWQGRPVTLRYEPVLLNTGGGLKNIEDLIANDEEIWVYNGDIMTDLPLERLYDAHNAGGKEVTLALRSTGALRNVGLDADGRICDFRFALGAPVVKNCLFTGVYIVNRSFLSRLEPGGRQDIVMVFLNMIRNRPGAVAGVVIDEGDWQDIGSIEAYEAVNGERFKGQGTRDEGQGSRGMRND